MQTSSAAPRPVTSTTREFGGIVVIPTGDRIILVPREDVGGGFGRRGHERSWSSDRADAALQDARRAVDEVVGYFRSIGVRPEEGAEPIEVEFDPTYPNAHYDLRRDSMMVGVDPRSGRSFAESRDVVAHELGHRIAKRLGAIGEQMRIDDPNAAVQEHLADVFASAYDKNDWTLGEDVGEPIRDMGRPERLGHPRTLAEAEAGIADGSLLVEHPVGPFGQTAAVPDWHVIAEVPNRAAAMIGERIGRDEMAKLYLDTLRRRPDPGMDLGDLAVAVSRTAIDKYGKQSPEALATVQAWQAVGLLPER